RPEQRVHALGVVDGRGVVSPVTLRAAIRDRRPGVRRHAIRVSERFLSQDPAVGNDLLARVTDDDSQVRLQLAFTLGQWTDSRVPAALAALASPSDSYQNAAVLSSLRSDNVSQVVAETIDRKSTRLNSSHVESSYAV